MTDQTTAAPPGSGLAGTARKGPSPTPRDLAARAASRDAAESHPGPAGSGRPSRAPRPANGHAPMVARVMTRATVTRHRAANPLPPPVPA